MRILKLVLILLLFLLISSFFSCNAPHFNRSGKTFRYLYKGATLYEYVDHKTIGDSIGRVEETRMWELNRYLKEFWSGKEYWVIKYNDRDVFINKDQTGWDNIVLDDSSGTRGKLIVKTIILEGDRIGEERESMEVLILDTLVNSPGLDYAPAISADGRSVYYVSDRPGSKLARNSDQPSHDFWKAEKENKYETEFMKPVNIDTATYEGWRSINTEFNEGVASIAADGRTLFFTACGRWDGAGDCDIYTAKIFEGRWTKPRNLGREVNSQYWDSQPSIAPDQQRLFFTSNREGPNGDENYDIWYCDWDPEFEEWMPARNLIAINTKGKEVAPFIAADNSTLFFSSDGYDNTLGQLDFYVTRYDEESGEWSDPAHLSAPLNTSEDDQFITLPASGDIIYFSSRRQDIPGYRGDFDLFMAFVPSFFRAVVIKVYVADDSDTDIPTFITVDNPVSSRKVKDKASQRDNILSMVLTNADYGRVNDSLPYIDLQIKADNSKFGTKTKTLRVQNPLIVRDRGGWVFTDEIDVTMEISVSPELDKYLNSLGRTVLDASVSARGFGGDNSDEKIKVEEFHSTYMRPLLHYVFFDDNSELIPERYVRLGKNEKEDFRMNNLSKLETLDTYYHILNIIGYRMSQYPDADLRVTACNSNSGQEKGNLKLSQARASNIIDYLTGTWEIDTGRIQIETRNLPENPSNRLSPEGISENRRVEFYSDDSRILEPVVTTDILKVATPPAINFESFVSVKGGKADWSFKATQDDKVLKEFKGEGSLKEDLVWDFEKERGTIPLSNSPIKFEMQVKDKKKDKVIVANGELPVEQVTKIKKIKEKLADYTIDRFSLILFDFGKSRLNEMNLEALNYIKEKVKDNSRVKVSGYTDALGNEKYNMTLSKKRAAATSKSLNIDNTEVIGMGESDLLYDNSIPEGRFYCRTVKIYVETPIEKSIGDLSTIGDIKE